jgi:hypothetical protein
LVDVELPGVGETLFNTIQAADLDVRASLFKAIVLLPECIRNDVCSASDFLSAERSVSV